MGKWEALGSIAFTIPQTTAVSFVQHLSHCLAVLTRSFRKPPRTTLTLTINSLISNKRRLFRTEMSFFEQWINLTVCGIINSFSNVLGFLSSLHLWICFKGMTKHNHSCSNNEVKNIYKETIENLSLHDISNGKGLKLMSFASSRNTLNKSTCFPKHTKIHLQAWISPGRVT